MAAVSAMKWKPPKTKTPAPLPVIFELSDIDAIDIAVLLQPEILMAGHLAPGGHIPHYALVGGEDFEHFADPKLLDLLRRLDDRHRAEEPEAVQRGVRLHFHSSGFRPGTLTNFIRERPESPAHHGSGAGPHLTPFSPPFFVTVP